MPMNFANAVVFLVMGAIMEILPGAFPAWFPRTGLDGSSTSSLWLHLMGFVGTGVSTVFCMARYVIPPVLSAMRTVKRVGAPASRDRPLLGQGERRLAAVAGL